MGDAGSQFSDGDPTASAVASQLAASWSAAWEFFSQDSGDSAVRAAALGHARKLLSFAMKTATCMTGTDRIPSAVVVLQTLGDGYAMMSEVWPIGSVEPTPPVRTWLVWYLRESGLDEWCAQQGHPLNLEEESGGAPADSEMYTSGLLPASGLNIATALASEAAMYKRAVEALKTEEGRLKYKAQAGAIRRIACRSLSEYRRASVRYQREAPDQRLTIDALSVAITYAELRFLLGAYAGSGDLDTFDPVPAEVFDEIYVMLGLDGWVRDHGLSL